MNVRGTAAIQPQMDKGPAFPNPAPGISAFAGMGRWLAVAMAVVLACGFGLQWIGTLPSDLPPVDAMAAEFARAAAAVAYGVSWESGAGDAGGLLWNSAWVVANGQYDARLLARAALLLHLVAIAVALGAVARRLSPAGTLAWVMLGLAMFAFCGGAGLRPLADTAPATVLILLSMMQVLLMAGRAASLGRIALGVACGVVGILATREGMAASVAILAWHAMAWVRGLVPHPRRRLLIGISAALTVGGVVWHVVVGATDSRVADFVELGEALAWPFATAAVAPVVWAPALLCVISSLRGDARRRDLAPFALLALALSIIAAGRITDPSGAGRGIAFFSLLINAACVVAWWCTSRRSAEGRLILASLWLVIVFTGLMSGGGARGGPRVGPDARDPAVVALRAEIARAARDPQSRWSDPELRAILPPSIRASVAVASEPDSPWLRQVPELPETDALPAVGTWRKDDASLTGEWAGDWTSSALPMLETRIGGTHQPPLTAVVLRTRDGREIEPWAKSFVSTDRWRRVLFPAPDEPFQLVVRDSSADLWIAVRAPVELGQLGWFTRKIDPLAPWIIALGWLAGFCAFAWVALQASRHAARVERADAAPFPWRLVPWIAMAGLAVYLAQNVDTTAGPNDSGGYLNSAVLISEGRIAAEVQLILGPGGADDDPRLHMPITFCVAPDGRMAPEYPVGLPLIIGALYKLMPRDAAVTASCVLHILFAILITRAVARRAGLPDGWAWLGGALVGLSPLTWFEGLQPVSDVPALVWGAAAIHFAWVSRERAGYAVLAGLAAAMAVLIRPSNALCLVPAALCLIGRWRQLGWWVLGGLPGALWLAWYQSRQYGGALSTGYGDSLTMFGLRYLWPTLKAYVRWLPELFTPVIMLAWAGPFVRSAPKLLRVVLAVWAISFVAFYSVYWCTWDSWFNMRFLLPAAPAMVVLALLALRALAARWEVPLFEPGVRGRGTALTLGLVGVVLAIFVVSGTSRRILFWIDGNEQHILAPQWAREHLPADSVIVAKHATGTLAYYTEFALLRMDHPKLREPGFLEQIAASRRGIYAITYHWEAFGALSDNRRGDGRPPVPGRWERLASMWEDSVYVWRWRPAAESAVTDPD